MSVVEQIEAENERAKSALLLKLELEILRPVAEWNWHRTPDKEDEVA
jgi:hypothetical protein